jgi:GNAT superfamily N-acetyltransferase
MQGIEIRKAALNDLDQLQKIARQTFYETFSAVNTAENMKKYLDERFSVEKLTAELSDSNTDFYFAALDNRVIGYLKINFGQSQTELRDDKAVDYIWLGVWEENHKALRFYRKNGFVGFDKHIFKLGDSEQTDFMMKFDLTEINNKTGKL